MASAAARCSRRSTVVRMRRPPSTIFFSGKSARSSSSRTNWVKNGSRVEFDRRKLRASMALALRKRPVAAEAADAAIHRIEEKLLSLGLREIASEKVGELVMRELKKLDKIGYVRFASVYRNFEDVDDFAEVIQEVRPRKRR